jgi:mannose-1-phosphate guanylyltransferase
MATKGILLVGGRGTRLLPLTETTPKPMLRVAGVPFTLHQLLKAKAAGISEIVLATSFMAEVFEPYFGDGSKFGLKIHYAVEKEALGTGGAIKNARNILDLQPGDSVVIFNGDVLSGHDLAGQISFHHREKSAVTLYLTEVSDARAFGCVPIDEQGNVTAFLEKMENPVTNLINAGCYIFDTSVFSMIPDGRVVSVERETFPKILEQGFTVKGFVDRSYWLDIGTPSALIKASRDLLSGVFSSPATPTHSAKALIEPGAQIAHDAVIGEGSFIGTGASIGSHCTISGSIIEPGAHIGAHSTLINCFVRENAVISENSHENSAILGF